MALHWYENALTYPSPHPNKPVDSRRVAEEPNGADASRNPAHSRPAGHPLSVPAGPRHARLDLRDPTAQYPEQGNRVAAPERLVFAQSYVDAIRLLGEVRGWLDFADEDLVRQAARPFGAGTGRRLQARLRAVEYPGRLDWVGDLIFDSETGEQLLGGIDRAGLNSA